VSEELANAFATSECLLRHRGLSFRRPEGRTFRRALAPALRVEFSIHFEGQKPVSGTKTSQIRSSDLQNAKRRAERKGAPARQNHSRHGLQKPEIAYLPTACEGKNANPVTHRLFVLPTQYGLTIAKIREGSPSVSTLFRVVRALGVPVARLLQ
jgi:hypothetical protein